MGGVGLVSPFILRRRRNQIERCLAGFVITVGVLKAAGPVQLERVGQACKHGLVDRVAEVQEALEQLGVLVEGIGEGDFAVNYLIAQDLGCFQAEIKL